MRRAEAKLQLSHNVVGDAVVNHESKELVGVEVSDLQSIIFGLHNFDPSEITNEKLGDVNISQMSTMAEKVIAMRHGRIAGKDDNRFEVNPTDAMDKCESVPRRNSADFIFRSGFDESSYLSWVEKFKKASEASGIQIMDLGRRGDLPEEKQTKLEAAKKKAEEKKLSKWEALGYQSLSVKDPIRPLNVDMMSGSGSVIFVYGDCTDPSKICPSEPTIIFRLV